MPKVEEMDRSLFCVVFITAIALRVGVLLGPEYQYECTRELEPFKPCC